MWRILTIVSAEPDQEGDSRDAMENRNGYFMIRGIMQILTVFRLSLIWRTFLRTAPTSLFPTRSWELGACMYLQQIPSGGLRFSIHRSLFSILFFSLCTTSHDRLRNPRDSKNASRALSVATMHLEGRSKPSISVAANAFRNLCLSVGVIQAKSGALFDK